MRKILCLMLMLLIVLPTVLAIDISLKEKESSDVLIAGLDKPATFELAVTNHGGNDDFYFFNLLGFTMEPKNPVHIDKGMTETINLKLFPRSDLTLRNHYTLQYFIRASDGTEQSESLTVNILDLEDAFEVGAGEVDPESNSLEIYIHNKESFDFNDLKVEFKSKFFELEETFDLRPNQRKDFSIELNQADFKELVAGFYTLVAKISIEDLEAEVDGVIKFVEKDVVETTSSDAGLVVSTKVIEKVNNGNTVSPVETTVQKNIISRLFTSFEPEPDLVDRQGTLIFYTWSKELSPGEALSVTVKTNWLYPLLIIILIVAVIVLAKKLTTTDVTIRKKISYVRAKGGQFALRVNLFVHSKTYVERVNIVDRLPPLMKVFDKFGGEKPSRVNEGARIIEWDFEKLEAGEIRSLSYIIYSKDVGVMGKFALPSATAIYQKEGEIKEASSNKAFFVTEQRKTSRDVEYY